MRQFLYILGLAVLISTTFGSCKKSTLDTLRDNELVALDKYIKDNNLADTKDISGIYFKSLSQGTDTTRIRSGFKVMMYFNITLIDGTVVFTTEDEYGHNYEEYAFYVDVSNNVVNANYVQQITGLHNGLKKMKIGEKAFMVIPSELAFKAVDNSSIGIPRFSTLLATVYAKKGYSPEQQAE
ncbi:MAG: FKBP-type peptidyl-prolyl cis-trans isomerase [Prolixibacteraceae bacterium]